MTNVTQQDRDALEKAAGALGWLLDDEREILLAAFTAYRLAIIEQCAGVVKDLAEEARYREQIGSEDMEAEHGAAADALCEAYAAIRSTAAKGV